MKKRISLLLVVAMVLSLIAVSPQTVAKTKNPKLAQKYITFDSVTVKRVSILNIKTSNIKKLTAKSTNPNIVYSFAFRKTIELSNYDMNPGFATVKVTLILKKPINNKKVWKYTINVTNNATTTTPSPTPATGNDAIKQIGERSVEYNLENNEHRVFFAFFNANQDYVAGSGSIVITFANNNGEVVYSNKHSFSENDFSNWTWNHGAIKKYICCIHIPDSQITQGSTSNGTCTMAVTLSNGIGFQGSDNKFIVTNLPAVITTPTPIITPTPVPTTAPTPKVTPTPTTTPQQEIPIFSCQKECTLHFNSNFFTLSDMECTYVRTTISNYVEFNIKGKVTKAENAGRNLSCSFKIIDDDQGVVVEDRILFNDSGLNPGESKLINETFPSKNIIGGKHYTVEFYS